MHTPAEIEQYFRDAADTLRRMPSGVPHSSLCAWPDIVRDFHESYGWNASDAKRIPPSPEQIGKLDVVLGWTVSLLDGRERKIVWARANNVGWVRISKFAKMRSCDRGWSVRNLQILHKKAIEKIMKKTIA